jgi:hypothetical protein
VEHNGNGNQQEQNRTEQNETKQKRRKRKHQRIGFDDVKRRSGKGTEKDGTRKGKEKKRNGETHAMQ